MENSKRLLRTTKTDSCVSHYSTILEAHLKEMSLLFSLSVLNPIHIFLPMFVRYFTFSSFYLPPYVLCFFLIFFIAFVYAVLSLRIEKEVAFWSLVPVNTRRR